MVAETTPVGLDTRTVHFGDTRVPYRFGTDCPDAVAAAVLDACPDASSAVLVVDRRALPHAAAVRERLSAHLRVDQYVLDPAERRKTLPEVQAVLDFSVSCGADRRTVVLAMGGGLAGNVAGLAAALLFRGTRLVHLPTTPVAAFDSVLSLKQAVNLDGGKNMCGAYHPPALIVADLAWLRTIPHRELVTGLAEMAKNVLAVLPAAEGLFLRALDSLADRSPAAYADLCAIGLDAKVPYLAGDPRERGAALVFEYGHTAGHALEFLSGGALSHGAAVAWGMLVAARISRARGYGDDLARHRRLLGPLLIPAERVRRAVPAGDAVLARTLLRDNKRGYLSCAPDELPMVLLRAGGGAVPGPGGLPLVPVPVDEVVAAIRAVLAG
ncbi:3-dehydroquinate synthase family protein [Actinoplanes sp. RD1]|uniref:3-dehydroquinate synthase family protein n=1 Tax=Actinoplanes sp. RD1 TaxID=3064538 RepID=UPI00274154E8|nr:iron-containing alcohol dehydrogenase [Actinoplanes sp. RD1]